MIAGASHELVFTEDSLKEAKKGDSTFIMALGVDEAC